MSARDGVGNRIEQPEPLEATITRYIYRVLVRAPLMTYEDRYLARADAEAAALAAERAEWRSSGTALLKTLQRGEAVELPDDEATRLRAENAKLAAEVRRLAARLERYEPADRGYLAAD